MACFSADVPLRTYSLSLCLSRNLKGSLTGNQIKFHHYVFESN